MEHDQERQAVEDALRRANSALEREVRERTAELESANRELETFSYSLSHGLRTPLRGVDGFAKILLEHYGTSLDEKGRHYLERVRAGTQRMADLIDDILRLSRLARAEIRRLPVDLGAVGRHVADELQRAGPERAVTFAIAEPLPVIGDPHLLRLAIENLLANAWKFTRSTSGARITLGTEEKDGARVLFVRDNGAGFDMQYAGKLFVPFQHLHDPEEFEGAGIGLATVERIITRHGGRIWAQGTPGHGATFWFTLPEAT